jgi:hypothetical protein
LTVTWFSDQEGARRPYVLRPDPRLCDSMRVVVATVVHAGHDLARWQAMQQSIIRFEAAGTCRIWRFGVWGKFSMWPLAFNRRRGS